MPDFLFNDDQDHWRPRRFDAVFEDQAPLDAIDLMAGGRKRRKALDDFSLRPPFGGREAERVASAGRDLRHAADFGDADAAVAPLQTLQSAYDAAFGEKRGVQPDKIDPRDAAGLPYTRLPDQIADINARETSAEGARLQALCHRPELSRRGRRAHRRNREGTRRPDARQGHGETETQPLRARSGR